jgi:hypothetical protein
MDGLALLCALHADGPQSLRRLRRSGCPSLDSVLEFDLERLAELLASTPAAAERFQREARHLITRLGSGASARTEAALLEVEEVVSAEAAARLPEPPRAYDRALARWRELDALEDAESAAEPIVEESSAPARHPSPRTPLTVLQDLADESRGALLAVGIVDLEALAACDALELSQATGLDYSNAVRWRSLARRALPEGTERFSRSGRPVVERPDLVSLDEYVMQPPTRTIAARIEEAAGGPFA